MVRQICWQRRETNGKRMRGGGQWGKAQCVVLTGSCVMCGNGVATAVSTYAPLFLSCCPAPWTAVPPAHTRIHTRRPGGKMPHLFTSEWRKVAVTQLIRVAVMCLLTYFQYSALYLKTATIWQAEKTVQCFIEWRKSILYRYISI